MKENTMQSDSMTSRLRLEEIQISLDQLQASSERMGPGVQETLLNTKALLQLLALIENPSPDEMSLAQNLEGTLADIRDRLVAIETILKPFAEMASQISTLQGTLARMAPYMQRRENLLASLDARFAGIEEQIGMLFTDEDSPAS